MTSQRFSKRHGLGGRKDALIYEDAPESLRKALFYVLSKLGVGSDWACWLEYAVSGVMRRPHRVNYDVEARDINEPGLESEWLNPEDKQELEAEVLTCKWFHFYDILEEIYVVLSQSGPFDSDDLVNRCENLLNQQLEVEGIGWRMTDGQLERVGTEYGMKIVQRARVLLRDQRFEGPDRQFEKAISFFNMRPNPDVENCVKDAVGAMEATARILANDEKALFPDIIDREPFKSGMHGALREATKRVYGYRGDVGGVAHGQVGLSKVGTEEAELVLAFCASFIVYLVNKFG